MSTPVARPAVRERAYAKITTPVFHMTGARDDSPIGETKAGELRIPFDKMTAAETYLVIFKDGDHLIFSGRPGLAEDRKKQDAVFQEIICAGSTAYCDAWLRNDAAAHAWLTDGGFAQRLGGQGTFETKKPAKLQEKLAASPTARSRAQKKRRAFSRKRGVKFSAGGLVTRAPRASRPCRLWRGC